MAAPARVAPTPQNWRELLIAEARRADQAYASLPVRKGGPCNWTALMHENALPIAYAIARMVLDDPDTWRKALEA